jgi:peptide-methionine (S)-S-oxide reductase
MSDQRAHATFGAGCFWCVEAIYQDLRGIHSVVSGYSGGHVENPSYQAVCTGETGHAEVVQIEFDPDVISFEKLLYIFWRTHDPTTLNRQGADTGTQYRSAVFYHDAAQQAAALASLAETEASDLWENPIVTQVTALENFYAAEEYHQNYFKNNPNQPYCAMVINPKVRKFRAAFLEELKAAE